MRRSEVICEMKAWKEVIREVVKTYSGVTEELSCDEEGFIDALSS